MMIEGEGMRISGKKKTRADKKPKIQAYISQEVHDKINRLARACNVSESQIASEMLTYLANHVDYITWIQTKFGVKNDDAFRIIPVKENGHIIY